MSQMTFIASSHPLKEVRNNKIKGYKLAPGARIEINESGGFDPVPAEEGEEALVLCDEDEIPLVVKVDSPEDFNEFEIYPCDHYREAYRGTCGYFYEFNLVLTEERYNQFVDYLKDQLETVEEIEIWSYWEPLYLEADLEVIEKPMKYFSPNFLKNKAMAGEYRCVKLRQ